MKVSLYLQIIITVFLLIYLFVIIIKLTSKNLSRAKLSENDNHLKQRISIKKLLLPILIEKPYNLRGKLLFVFKLIFLLLILVITLQFFINTNLEEQVYPHSHVAKFIIRFPLYSIAFMLGTVGIIFGFFILGEDNNHKAKLIIGFSSLLTISSLFSFSLQSFSPDFNFYGNAGLIGLTNEYVSLGNIGPFVTAEFNRLEKEGRSSLEVMLKKIRKYKESDIIYFNIIGGYDKRKLRNQKVKEYGTNISLAQARANWVRDTILAITKLRMDKIITSIEGPSSLGEKPDSVDLAADRCVSVFALIKTKDN